MYGGRRWRLQCADQRFGRLVARRRAGGVDQFFAEHFGFHQEMAADEFAPLARDDAGMNLVSLRRGKESLPADQRHDRAGGLILAFEVDDLHGELARLQAEGAAITMPQTDDPWGERAFQVRDPNGVIIQLRIAKIAKDLARRFRVLGLIVDSTASTSRLM